MKPATPTPSTPVTFALIAIIVAYFVLQALLGVSIENPSSSDLLKFGANFLPLSVQQPWRLLSAGFVHIGIMHLLFNSFALYYFGIVAERLFGKARFLWIFLACVIASSLLSLYHAWFNWQAAGTGVPISAGASGGVMGIGMALTVLAFSRHPNARLLNKRSFLTVMVVNFMIGFAIDGIDNAGHIGGALMGALLMLILLKAAHYFWLLSLVAFILLGVCYWQLVTAVSVYL